MADGRRQSASSRTATPKPGAQGPSDTDDVLSKAIGARIKLTTIGPANVTLEGTIFTASRTMNLLTINTATPTPAGATPSSQPGDYHLIPLSSIQNFSILSLSNAPTPSNGAVSGSDNVQPSISRIDLKALKAREEAAIRKMKERDATRGKGVTKEAQEIFDGLSRTLPTRWHETSIVVSDAVIIKPPYGLENCSAPKDQQNALARVKKVLENEQRKIAERATKVAVATPLDGPRKGG